MAILGVQNPIGLFYAPGRMAASSRCTVSMANTGTHTAMYSVPLASGVEWAGQHKKSVLEGKAGLASQYWRVPKNRTLSHRVVALVTIHRPRALE